MYPKYIVFACGTDILPVIFGDTGTSHYEIAEAIQDKFPTLKPISAGFCSITTFLDDNEDDPGDGEFEATIKAFGESVTLKLQADPRDSELLSRHFIPQYRENHDQPSEEYLKYLENPAVNDPRR